MGKTVLCIARIIHDAVAHLKDASRIVPAADRLRNPADRFFQKINVCKIVEINDRTKLIGKCKFLRRRIIGGKHDVFSIEALGIRKHQLCQRRTVTSAVIFF